jgi:hypothetical protein
MMLQKINYPLNKRGNLMKVKKIILMSILSSFIMFNVQAGIALTLAGAGWTASILSAPICLPSKNFGLIVGAGPAAMVLGASSIVAGTLVNNTIAKYGLIVFDEESGNQIDSFNIDNFDQAEIQLIEEMIADQAEESEILDIIQEIKLNKEE